jgi:hypothetical protein
MDLKVEKLVNSILDGQKNNNSVNDSLGGNHYSMIESKLREKGFSYATSTSRCSKASREINLAKDGFKVNIIVANCMGEFTQVTCCKVTSN